MLPFIEQAASREFASVVVTRFDPIVLALGRGRLTRIRAGSDSRTGRRGKLSVMDSELPSAGCFVCTKHVLGDSAPGGVLVEDELVYAGHAYPLAQPVLAYRGYLVAEPKRHARGIG